MDARDTVLNRHSVLPDVKCAVVVTASPSQLPMIFAASPVSRTMCSPVFARSARYT